MSTRPVGVLDILTTLGTPAFIAEMSIPFVWFAPGTTDPDSQPVIQIIKALQRGLRTAGFPVQVSGVYDLPTARVVKSLGLDPFQSTWIQMLCGALMIMRHPDRSHREMTYLMTARPAATGSFFEYHGPPVGPLPGKMMGLPPGPLGLGDTTTDAGVSLSFGKGISDPLNIVPIPKQAGTTTFDAFLNLQRQTNRVLATVSGAGRVEEDGILGKRTLTGVQRAYAQAQDILQQSLSPLPDNTVGLAARAVSIAIDLQRAADQRGVAATANKQATPPPVREVMVPPPLSPAQVSAMSAMSSSTGALVKPLAFLAIAAAAAWWWSSRQKAKTTGRARAVEGVASA